MTSLSDTVQEWFLESRWHPNREMPVPASIPHSHPAYEILRRFGGITLLERECASTGEPIEEFRFRALDEKSERIAQWSSLLQSKLVGIADVHNAHAELYVDESGRCFGISLIHDAFYFYGDTLSESIEAELEGRRHRPLLRPEQASVMLYGERIARDDPQVYDYENAK